MKTFLFTCGDVNGIGPEIVLKTLNRLSSSNYRFIFAIPQNIFEETSSLIAPAFSYNIISASASLKGLNSASQVIILDIGNAKSEKGTPTGASGKTAFKAIKKSFDLVKNNLADAVITAPISKHALNMAGINYPGHTEMYAEWSGADDYVMMFLSEKMNAALATIHEPVKKHQQASYKKRIISVLNTCYYTLKDDLKIKSPKIAVLGLNPHAGENGIIGNEEEIIIKPAVRQLDFKDCIEGPFSPDAFFANSLFKNYDLVIGMYHDQVLIPFKMLNFSKGVNYTAGLPIIRTSPDHGTAFDIAWQNKADESSIFQAFKMAERIVKNRLK